MPNTAEGVTYPDSGGHTRLWEHLQTLATTVTTALQARIKGSATTGNKRLHWQTFPPATADALGNVTYTHAAGFTPSCVIPVSNGPATYFPMVWGVDSLTATQFRVRYSLANGDAAAASQNVPGINVMLAE